MYALPTTEGWTFVTTAGRTAELAMYAAIKKAAIRDLQTDRAVAQAYAEALTAELGFRVGICPCIG